MAYYSSPKKYEIATGKTFTTHCPCIHRTGSLTSSHGFIRGRMSKVHRLGMRLSRVCAWGTSKYAFDGSGMVDRHSIYHFEHGKKVYNYSLCTFQNGKIYNCDLSAAQNIGARFFLREYQKKGVTGFPSTPLRTLSTLREFVNNGLPVAA